MCLREYWAANMELGSGWAVTVHHDKSTLSLSGSESAQATRRLPPPLWSPRLPSGPLARAVTA